ncbi:MAG TPA: TonB-dependent receptor [Dehalococcoidia bacterium]|nr:TonB-dependent receptor [Dehalococcoidia bacterium]
MNAGVENLFDKSYIDHLSGFNRVQNSAVAVGQRLPGPGRNVYMTVNYDW